MIRTKHSLANLGRSAVLSAALLLAAAPGVTQAASVRVVHGIPGGDVSPAVDPALPVDVLVNDQICLLSGFTFGTIAGPYTLPAGTFNVKVSLANTLEPCGNDAVIEGDIPIVEGENASIVAHLTADGSPTASKFVNNVSATEGSNARLIAHHVAAAPTVDLSIGGVFRQTISVPNVSNSPGQNQLAAELPPGSFNIGVAPAGQRSPIFIRNVLLAPNLAYTAYAVGSLANGTFTMIVEPIGGLDGVTIRF